MPKSDSHERRIIVDLSWPVDESVNDGIDGEMYLGESSDLHFPTIDDIISLIHNAGQGCLIYKRDLKLAYRQFLVDPGDWQYLGYFFNMYITLTRFFAYTRKILRWVFSDQRERLLSFIIFVAILAPYFMMTSLASSRLLAHCVAFMSCRAYWLNSAY